VANDVPPGVLIVAVAFAVPAMAGGIFSGFGAGANAMAGLAGAAMFTVGSMAINAIAPPPSQDTSLAEGDSEGMKFPQPRCITILRDLR